VAHEEPLASPDIIHFNHGLAQVITALMTAGMSLRAIEEHDTVPWNPLQHAMEDVGGREYRLRHPAGHQPPRSTLTIRWRDKCKDDADRQQHSLVSSRLVVRPMADGDLEE